MNEPTPQPPENRGDSTHDGAHRISPAYRWMLRLTIIMPTCLLVTIRTGDFFLRKQMPWYRIHMPGEWVIWLLVIIGTVCLGVARDFLLTAVQGDKLPRTGIDRVFDLMVFLILQVLAVPLFLITCFIILMLVM